MKRITKSFIYIAAALCTGLPATAQDFDKKEAPSAVLFQLRTEHNRIAALQKTGYSRELEEVKNDAAIVTERLKSDFHDNFTLCPVYYYNDVNVDSIKNRKFKGIITYEDGTPVADSAIARLGNNYVIAYYGYPVFQIKKGKTLTDTAKYTYDPEPGGEKGLVILNGNFQQLTYYYKYGYDELMFWGKNWKKYIYRSKHFDIQYYPFATRFQQTLFRRYGNHRL
jgi:hypothetical protein